MRHIDHDLVCAAGRMLLQQSHPASISILCLVAINAVHIINGLTASATVFIPPLVTPVVASIRWSWQCY